MEPITFTVKQRELLTGPGVYVFRHRSGKAAYIGTTAFGLARALAHNHKMRDIPNLSLEFIPCPTESAAFDLEVQLIGQHMPTYNVMLNNHGFIIYNKKAQEKFDKAKAKASPFKVEEYTT